MKIFKNFFKDNQKLNASEITLKVGDKYKTLDKCIGDLLSLKTKNKSDFISALNEVNTKTYEVIKEVSLNSETQNITINDLDLATDKRYKIEFRGSSNVSGEIMIKLNNITGHYNHIALATSGTTPTNSDNILKNVWRAKADQIAYSMIIDNSKTECMLSMDLYRDILSGDMIKYDIDYSYPHAYSHALSFIRGQIDLDYVVSNITSITISNNNGTFRENSKVIVKKIV